MPPAGNRLDSTDWTESNSSTDLKELLPGAGPLPIDKYIYLRDLRSKNPTEYYRLLLEHGGDVLPFIYTPTVGQACQEYHTLPLKTRGLYLSLEDRGHILDKLRAWPQQHVRVIVVTDGERILGLGDLGANGMGISEGKIELYTAAAGVDPAVCLPVCLDVGTHNAALREHPAYRGRRGARPTGHEYDSFLDEVMTALQEWQPHCLLQLEDFGNTTAFKLLERYQPRLCCFDDDIQGTASIVLAALLSALKVTGAPLSGQRIMFLGAGEAATGIATLISQCMVLREGLSLEDARRRCFLLDSHGLVVASRTDLQPHKQPFANHGLPAVKDLKAALRAVRPTALVGVAAVGGAFDQEVVELMSEWNDRPIVFPLSNPTPLSECTFEQAFTWSKGKALFASGSPFPAIVDQEGVLHPASQANNAYIFPAVGHAAVLAKAKSIPEEVFLVAAEALASMADPADRTRTGRLFPPFARIRHISAHLMAAVVHWMVGQGVGTTPQGWPVGGTAADFLPYAKDAMWTTSHSPPQAL